MDSPGSALDSLLGRLTAVLVNEAQLLGRVRSDVEFIKDEMESMNGLILHLTEAQHRDHQVRAWMKQVVGLTRDCEGNVQLYVQYIGSSRPGDDDGGGRLLVFLRQTVRFLRTIPVRCRVAARIRELKVRARDVGDRRQRYGVTVPALATAAAAADVVDAEPAARKQEEDDLGRRALLLEIADDDVPRGEDDDEEVVRGGVHTLMLLMSLLSTREPGTTTVQMQCDDDDLPQQPRVTVFNVIGLGLANEAAVQVWFHSLMSTKFKFGCHVWCDVSTSSVTTLLARILEQLQDHHRLRLDEDSGEEQLLAKIQGHLKGKRFFILVTTSHVVLRQDSEEEWRRVLEALLHAADGSLPGSVLTITTDYDNPDMFPRPCDDTIRAPARLERTAEFYKEKAMDAFSTDVSEFFQVCGPNTFAMKTFLHLLYVHPNVTEEELQNYKNAISECRRLERSISVQVLRWCYNELPSKYRSCLLYFTVFPEGHIIRTTSLARRWLAEGLITAAATTSNGIDEIQSSTDEAAHYLDVLFIGGFVSPVEIDPAGNIKSCTLHHEVREFIATIATDLNFMDSNLPPHLARYLSIHNRLGLQRSHSDSDNKDIAAYVPSLAASPQWQLMKVLDLEGCKGLLGKKKNLKSICKILLLKYLSLRNTDVTELPMQIKDLQCLETLDIRQTKVRMLANKVIVLPQLKHFLAGHKVPTSNDSSSSSEDSFSAVRMPLCIQKMRNMEVLSHVHVSNTIELAGIAQLLKLRKFGVCLRGKNTKLSDLFLQIQNFNECLRSLSIRVDPHPLAGSEIQDARIVDPLCSAPHFIERLNISGISRGLRHLIQENHKLTKITLSEAHLEEDDLTTLGKLGALRCLRLQHNSYTSVSEITFWADEFQSLHYLLVEGKDITKIRFALHAAPNLERIVWSFAGMHALSGLKHLTKLKKLELIGDCDLRPIKYELLGNHNPPTIKHKPHPQSQEERTAAATSSSSAP